MMDIYNGEKTHEEMKSMHVENCGPFTRHERNMINTHNINLYLDITKIISITQSKWKLNT